MCVHVRVILCTVLLIGGCGGEPAGDGGEPGPAGGAGPPDISGLLGEPVSWRVLPSGRRARGGAIPAIELRVHEFRGALSTSGPVQLDGDYALEFLPLVDAAPRRGCSIELALESRLRSTVVWKGPLQFVQVPKGGVGSLARFARASRVPLADQRGRSVSLSWRVSKACAELPSGIANARLVAQSTAPRPPILFVCSDQHRWDHSLGERGVELMPRLHEFARESVVYPRAYANASWTLPSIVSVLTGLRPRYHGTGRRIASAPMSERPPGGSLPRGQFWISWDDRYHVFSAYPSRLATLGERLQRRGYRTAAVVSNPFYVGSGLLRDGFDLVVATGPRGENVNAVALNLLRHFPLERPLFLLVHYMDVHEYRNWARPEAKEAGFDRETLLANYALRVRDTDRNLGALLRAWDRRRGLASSLVAFYSDHGEHLGEPGARGRHGVSMDEVLLRVPLAVHYPDALGIAPHSDERPVALVDLVPTVLEVTGGLPEDDPLLHGASLLGPGQGETERHIFADHQLYGDELSSLRAGPHKLVVNWTRGTRQLIEPRSASPRVPEAQWRVEDPARQRELEQVFEEYVREAEVFTSGLRWDRRIDREELEEQLRAIGYAE